MSASWVTASPAKSCSAVSVITKRSQIAVLGCGRESRILCLQRHRRRPARLCSANTNGERFEGHVLHHKIFFRQRVGPVLELDSFQLQSRRVTRNCGIRQRDDHVEDRLNVRLGLGSRPGSAAEQEEQQGAVYVRAGNLPLM